MPKVGEPSIPEASRKRLPGANPLVNDDRRGISNCKPAGLAPKRAIADEKKPAATEPNGNKKPCGGLIAKLGEQARQAHELCKNTPVTGSWQQKESDALLLHAFLRLMDFDRPCFPLHAFPSLVRQYIVACARSIHCSPDLLAVPLLAVAGAAIGRSGRKLKVKNGWTVTSCLWTAALTPSSGGKTPAMNSVQNFYDDRQEAEHRAYQDAMEAHRVDPEHNKRPDHYPALKLTDTTIESLRCDLMGGPVLFARDELGGWCHQMGQYKSGNADRFDWCSFWSHSAVSIGRKTERVFVREPFVAVTGMMVPASARELNYRGQADDGFVHRMLLAFPEEKRPVATLEEVPDELAEKFKRRMNRLFDPPTDDGKTLIFEPKAIRLVIEWANNELYPELRPSASQDYVAPGWLVSKYRKLHENCLRVCLVLHELWRVAGGNYELGRREKPAPYTQEDMEEELRGWDPERDLKDGLETFEPDPRDFYGERIAFQSGVVDRLTVERAIAVIEYFRGHIELVQSLLGEEVDDVDQVYNRLRRMGTVSVRQVIHKTTWKSRDNVLATFSEWQRRGYGEIQHPKKNQTVFVFEKE